jgi:hypothetical protein
LVQRISFKRPPSQSDFVAWAEYWLTERDGVTWAVAAV